MKRFYVIVFLLIAAAACIGLAIAEDAGYVLLAYKSFRYESSVWATLALIVVLWLLIWGIKLLVELVTASTGLVNPWSRRNRSRRVQIAIEQGQMDLAEGRWASAQKIWRVRRRLNANRCCFIWALPVRPMNRATTRRATNCLSARCSVNLKPNWRLP